MIDTPLTLDEPRGILVALGSARARERAVELDKAQLVLAWADAHPGDDLADAGRPVLTWQHAEEPSVQASGRCVLGGDRALQLAGIGTPLVAEFALVELAAALECSSTAARRLVGDLLELRHRLPDCWRRLGDLEVPLWRLRRLAQATVDLTPEAAAYVDRHVARVVHTVGLGTIEQIVTRARWAYEPDEARELVERSAASRDVQVRFGDGRCTVAADVTATLDHVDAVDFERAVAAGAQALAVAGSTESLAARRAQAVGVIARGDVTLSFPAPDDAGPAQTQTIQLPTAAREVVLHVHLSEAALATSPLAPGVAGAAATIEQGPLRTVPAELVRAWCGARSTTRITVRPVLDPSVAHGSHGYVPTQRLAEQVLARDTGCVFPGCTRAARGCDLDHVVPFGAGGATSDDNLAPLCRLHHRLKTHGGWRYTRLGSRSHDAGTVGADGADGAAYEWTSPNRQRFLVTSCVGRPPETRRLADLLGGRDGPAAISIDPPPRPGIPAEDSLPHRVDRPGMALVPAPF